MCLPFVKRLPGSVIFGIKYLFMGIFLKGLMLYFARYLVQI